MPFPQPCFSSASCCQRWSLSRFSPLATTILLPLHTLPEIPILPTSPYWLLATLKNILCNGTENSFVPHMLAVKLYSSSIQHLLLMTFFSNGSISEDRASVKDMILLWRLLMLNALGHCLEKYNKEIFMSQYEMV